MHLLLAAALAATTPSPAPTPTASPIPQIAHVVTSDRSEESLARATRVTYLVTADRIARQGYRTIGDALADVPGVEITNYGAIGANQSYGIRGSTSAQVLVLVDGLPAPGSLGNSVNLGTFSTSGVARIEVVEGGGSTLYGTGAMGGIINIITASAPQSGASVRWGSFGDRQLDVSAAGFSFERVVADNDYPLPAYSAGGVAAPATRANSSYQSSTGRFGWSGTLGALEAQLQLGLDASQGGAPGYFPYVSNSSTQDQVDRSAVLTLRERRKRATTTLQLGETMQQIAFSCSLAIDPYSCGQYSASLSTQFQTSLGLRNAVDAGAQRLVYGIDLSRGTVATNDGGSTLPPPSNAPPPPNSASAAMSQAAVFFQDAADLSASTSVYAGLRGERDGALGGEISPALGLQQRLSNTVRLKLNYAHAFRAPNASELYYPGYGNPDLRPERAQVADATVSATTHQAEFSAGWFTNQTKDLIVPTLVFSNPSKYVYVYEPLNVDHASMAGLTFEAKLHPFHATTVGFALTDLYRALDTTTRTRLPNDPVINATVSLEVAGAPAGAFAGAGVTQRFVGARGPVDPFTPAFIQPVAYANTNAYVAFRLAPRLNLYLRAFNLGDERYAEVAGFPMPGRAVGVELRTK